LFTDGFGTTRDWGLARSVEEKDEEDENEQEMVPKLRRFSMRKVEATRTLKTF
jgi:hypothetical protein